MITAGSLLAWTAEIGVCKAKCTFLKLEYLLVVRQLIKNFPNPKNNFGNQLILTTFSGSFAYRY